MRLQTVYVVQAFGRRRGRLTQAETIQFESERRARATGRSLRPRRAGVVVYSMAVEALSGEGCDEPRVLEIYGAAPSCEHQLR